MPILGFNCTSGVPSERLLSGGQFQELKDSNGSRPDFPFSTIRKSSFGLPIWPGACLFWAGSSRPRRRTAVVRSPVRAGKHLNAFNRCLEGRFRIPGATNDGNAPRAEVGGAPRAELAKPRGIPDRTLRRQAGKTAAAALLSLEMRLRRLAGGLRRTRISGPGRAGALRVSGRVTGRSGADC
jgi:hypothetical protein